MRERTPSDVKSKESKMRDQNTSNKDGKSRVSNYKPGEEVLYKSPTSILTKWLPAKIIKRISPLVYSIKIESGNTRLAHGFQLKPKITRKTGYYIPHTIPHEPSKHENTALEFSDEEENIGWETPPPFRFSLRASSSNEMGSRPRNERDPEISTPFHSRNEAPESVPRQSTPQREPYKSRLRPRALLRAPNRFT